MYNKLVQILLNFTIILQITKVIEYFQSLFNKDNQKITKAFAEAMLDEKIHHMTINEDKELLSDTLDKKLEF